MAKISLLLLPFTTALLLQSAVLKTPASAPEYFADKANAKPTPLSAHLDFETPGLLTVVADSRSFQIPLAKIDWIGYNPVVLQPASTSPILRVLTIGYFDELRQHHNVVIQLPAAGSVTTLRELEKCTGLTLGASPRKI